MGAVVLTREHKGGVLKGQGRVAAQVLTFNADLRAGDSPDK